MGAEKETVHHGNGVVVSGMDTKVDAKFDGDKKMESNDLDTKSVAPVNEQVKKSSGQADLLKSVTPGADQVVRTGEQTVPAKNLVVLAAEEVVKASERTASVGNQAAAAPIEAGQVNKTSDQTATATKSAAPVTVKATNLAPPVVAEEKTEQHKGKAVEEKETNINTLLLNDDEVASTLAAASEKLAAAHAKDKKTHKSGLAKFFSAFSPKRLIVRFRDCYVNTCMMAAEKGDFADLVAGHPGMFYAGDSVMSRTASQKRERDHEEVLASLSRQVSASLSRQGSQANRGSSPGLNRTTSTGIAGLRRNASTGMAGLSRQASGGIGGLNRTGSTGISSLSRQASTGISGSTFGRNSSARRHVPDSELFKAGRITFLESVAAKNAAAHGNADPSTKAPVVKSAESGLPLSGSSTTSINKVSPQGKIDLVSESQKKTQ